MKETAPPQQRGFCVSETHENRRHPQGSGHSAVLPGRCRYVGCASCSAWSGDVVSGHSGKGVTTEEQLQALGVGYTRMEQCVMELVKAIHLLVEQNAALIQACAEQDQEAREEPVGYLSLKRR